MYYCQLNNWNLGFILYLMSSTLSVITTFNAALAIVFFRTNEKKNEVLNAKQSLNDQITKNTSFCFLFWLFYEGIKKFETLNE